MAKSKRKRVVAQPPMSRTAVFEILNGPIPSDPVERDSNTQRVSDWLATHKGPSNRDIALHEAASAYIRRLGLAKMDQQTI